MTRLRDIFASLLALIILLPLLAVVAITVRLHLGSPIFFCQTRPGLQGKLFMLRKFRTMRMPRADEDLLTADSVHLTHLGRVLRSTSLDELPTLWNVLRGDMSLVGPRPLLPEYLPLYTAHQMRRHEVKPRITGWAQETAKTRQFRDAKYVGDPINAIRIFNDKEVDELMVLDISASKEGQQPNYALIEQFAGECFMPICYGGCVRNVEQANRIFDLGVEKVCLQTAALEDLGLITRLSEQVGSQSVMVSVDVKRNILGKPQLCAAVNGKSQSIPWLEFVQEAVAAGAGEVLINAVARDGTMKGMDLGLIRQASEALSVPLIAVGGAGSLVDIRAAVEAGASAVAAGAFFVFHGPHRAVLIPYPRYDEFERLLEFC